MKTSSAVAAEPGLRERKKAQTRADLERAAVELALDHDDIDRVTVDDICARVPVSHRTFFNYFDSKEDALFGIRRAWGDPQLVARTLAASHGGDVVESVIRTLFVALPSETQDLELREARLLLASRRPGLVNRNLHRLGDLREGLVEAVAQLIERETPIAVDAEVDASARAELIVVACIGAVRIAVREWADEGAVGAPEDVADRAVAIARTLGSYL
ncbi:TetR/AcrR family transcriptional regulator [Leifsonia sp. F6_8S_P_1B]|uniref:TetR/AcrR family transcriptional regulator n=1 Tax=Leifsonia williamsii TaxID=3035919 RepID=A0ABT8K900_9MICO|nr:TetR/AcrR family transcriptional regulator [Leifsonia williamsii]MDN4613923.1 TetR/AcrR family transcriptional regulator [Leifsonia williamsii]